MVTSFINDNKGYDSIFLFNGVDLLEIVRTELKKISHSGNLGYKPPVPDKLKVKEQPKIAETLN